MSARATLGNCGPPECFNFLAQTKKSWRSLLTFQYLRSPLGIKVQSCPVRSRQNLFFILKAPSPQIRGPGTEPLGFTLFVGFPSAAVEPGYILLLLQRRLWSPFGWLVEDKVNKAVIGFHWVNQPERAREWRQARNVKGDCPRALGTFAASASRAQRSAGIALASPPQKGCKYCEAMTLECGGMGPRFVACAQNWGREAADTSTRREVRDATRSGGSAGEGGVGDRTTRGWWALRPCLRGFPRDQLQWDKTLVSNGEIRAEQPVFFTHSCPLCPPPPPRKRHNKVPKLDGHNTKCCSDTGVV